MGVWVYGEEEWARGIASVLLTPGTFKCLAFSDMLW